MTDRYLLNTRSIDQSSRVKSAFEVNGFKVVDLPCIEIVGTSVNDELLQKMNAIIGGEALIFTSQYAVKHAFAIDPDWQINKKCQVIAVGTKTAEVLEQYFTGDIWLPEQHNSDGVIELLKGMNHSKAIILVTAPNGRKKIERFADAKGLVFQKITVYERQRPVWSVAQLEVILDCDQLVVLATSVTTLEYLSQGVPEIHWQHLLKATMLCASSRIVTVAESMGFEDCINVGSADPAVMAQLFKND